jgi:hypothetical protein
MGRIAEGVGGVNAIDKYSALHDSITPKTCQKRPFYPSNTAENGRFLRSKRLRPPRSAQNGLVARLSCRKVTSVEPAVAVTG